MLGKKAYFVHDLFDLADSVGFVFVKVEVIKSLGDDIVYGRALVKRRRGILEDHLYITDDRTVEGTGDLAGNAHAFIKDLAV